MLLHNLNGVSSTVMSGSAAKDFGLTRPKLRDVDANMMRRCIALSQDSGEHGEYPYAAIICRDSEFVCESINRAARDHDVTRHAELVAISEAQKLLGVTSLDDCTIYANVEPCASCSYAIRESRIGRVVYGLQSPLMGGHSRWNILADQKLSEALPEVFAPAPEIMALYMADETESTLRKCNPLIWHFIRERALLVSHLANANTSLSSSSRERSIWRILMGTIRRNLIDRIGRG